MNEENKTSRRKELRVKEYNYSRGGAYFVTICIKDRKQILSRIIYPVGGGALDAPQVRLSSCGEIIEKYLLSSENISGVIIDRYVIMPDHIHAIIILEPEKYAKHSDRSSRAPTPTNEMLPHVISTFKRFCNKEIGRNIFQRGYYEHIIRDKVDYERHVRYIHVNPRKRYYEQLNK